MNFNLLFKMLLVSLSRRLILKLNWRQIIRVILKYLYVQTMMPVRNLVKNASINIRWELRTPKTTSTSFRARLAKGAHLNIELNCHHSWHAHNALCNGHITQEICGAFAQMVLSRSAAADQVNLNWFLRFVILKVSSWNSSWK